MIERRAVLDYRMAVHSLGRRLPRGELARAAGIGLQDSGPWSGILSLHARVGEVERGAWEDPSLVQVFGPRGAIYLVPLDDRAVFTVGLLPRDPERRAAIERAAEMVSAALAGRSRRQADAVVGLPGGSRAMRWAATTGRFVARWDARDTWVVPADTPDGDEEQWRAELARRFFRAMGPATAAGLQWFVAGSRADAEATMAAIRSELVAVRVAGDERWLLAEDADLLGAVEAEEGVRLLPPDDPFLARIDKELIVPDPDRRAELWPRAPAPGALLVDGEIAGTWRRRGRRVTVTAWHALRGGVRHSAEREVETMPLPGPVEESAIVWR